MSSMNAYPNFDDATSRGPSQGLWGKCPHNMNQLLDNPSLGWFIWDDFTSFTAASSGVTSDWALTSGTAATAIPSVQGNTNFAEGGLLKLLSSTSQYAGNQLQKPGTAFLPAANRTIFFEVGFNTAFASSSLCNKLFVGLSEIVANSAVLSVSDATTVTSANYVGHKCLTADGVVLFESVKASSTVIAKASTTLVTATNIKLGFKIRGLTKVTHYVNGVEQSTSGAAANIPIVALSPSICFLSQTAAAQTSQIDWIRCAQVVGEF